MLRLMVEMVRVLIFSVIFSLICLSHVYSFEVKGDVSDNIKNVIEKYHNELGFNGIEQILKAFNIELYVLNRDYLQIQRGLRIKSIKFKGNFAFLRSKLMNVINLYPNDLYNTEVLVEADHRLLEFYRDKGFRDAIISHKSDKGKIIFYITEGHISIINEIKVEGVNLNIDDLKRKNIILNSKNLKSLKNKITYNLRKHGYFQFDISYKIIKNDKRTFYFNLNYPLVTLSSLLLQGNNSKTLIFNVTNLKKYILNINIKNEKFSNKIKTLIWKQLERIDYFHIRQIEIDIKKMLKKLNYDNAEVNIKVEDDKIDVNILLNEKITYKPVILKFKTSDTIKLLENRHFFANKQSFENIKNQLIALLKNKGFLDVKIIKIMKSDKQITMMFDEGIRYKINLVKIGDNNINTCKGMIYSKKNINKCLNKVDNKLSKKYYYNFLKFKKIINKQHNKVDLELFDNLKKPFVTEVVTSNKTITKLINNHYFKNNKLTRNKINDIQTFLKSQKAIQSSKLTIVNLDENNVILCVYLEYEKANDLFGGLTYDSIDGVRFHLGYTRYNFLNTAHNFSAFTLNSFRENLLQFKIQGNGIVYKDIEDTIRYTIRSRDEYDFKFKQNRLSLVLNSNFSHFMLSGSVYTELIDIYENSYTQEVKNNLTKYFNNLGFIISCTLHNFDNIINPANGMAIKYQFNPVYSKNSQFNVNVVYASAYKTVNKFTFSLKADMGKIFGKTVDIPLIYRFTLGGPYKMKAFAYRDIGSKDSSGSVYGGEIYSYGELVARYNYNNFIAFGPFYEMGLAEEEYDINDYSKDIGALFEIKTPIGPLKFSYAVDLDKKTRRAFYITFGTTIP